MGSADQSIRSISCGGAKICANTRALRGGNVFVIFGTADVDLREANLPARGADLRLTALFGRVVLHVPYGWPVRVNGNPAFGATQVEIQNTEIAAATGPCLRVSCGGLCGRITIEN